MSLVEPSKKEWQNGLAGKKRGRNSPLKPRIVKEKGLELPKPVKDFAYEMWTGHPRRKRSRK